MTFTDLHIHALSFRSWASVEPVIDVEWLETGEAIDDVLKSFTDFDHSNNDTCIYECSQ